MAEEKMTDPKEYESRKQFSTLFFVYDYVRIITRPIVSRFLPHPFSTDTSENLKPFFTVLFVFVQITETFLPVKEHVYLIRCASTSYKTFQARLFSKTHV